MMPMSLTSVAMIGLASVCLGIGWRMGARHAQEDCATAQMEATQSAQASLDAAVKSLDAANRRAAAASGRAQARQSQTAANFRSIQQGQINHAHQTRQSIADPDSDCRLDADGLRLWRAANANAAIDAPLADADPARSPDGSLPGAAPAHGAGHPGAADEPYRRGTELSRVPGQAGGAGRLGADQ